MGLRHEIAHKGAYKPTSYFCRAIKHALWIRIFARDLARGWLMSILRDSSYKLCVLFTRQSLICHWNLWSNGAVAMALDEFPLQMDFFHSPVCLPVCLQFLCLWKA